jgi:ectoine hydroxylase-related dioxygenase (phytanoyl-CoA dioxygenase family)
MQIRYFSRRTATVEEVKAYIDEWGFAVVTDLGAPDTMNSIDHDIRRYGRNVQRLELEFFGGALKKVEGLAAKSAGMIDLLSDEFMLDLAEHFMGAEPLLNGCAGFILEEGQRAQALHYDSVLYEPMLPRSPDMNQNLLHCMVAVTDFTAENGATRIIPGSHKWPAGRAPGEQDEVLDMVMPRGAVAIWLGSTWHGAGQNRTGQPRLGADMGFNPGWLRPHEAYHLMVPPGLARDLPVRVQELLGYKAHRGMLGVIEQRSPSEVFGFNRYVPARAAGTDGKELKIGLDALEAWADAYFSARELPGEIGRHLKRLKDTNQQRAATAEKSKLDMLENVGEAQARAFTEAMQAAGLGDALATLAKPH